MQHTLFDLTIVLRFNIVIKFHGLNFVNIVYSIKLLHHHHHHHYSLPDSRKCRRTTLTLTGKRDIIKWYEHDDTPTTLSKIYYGEPLYSLRWYCSKTSQELQVFGSLM